MVLVQWRVRGSGSVGIKKEPVEERGSSWTGSFQYTPFEGGLIGYLVGGNSKHECRNTKFKYLKRVDTQLLGGKCPMQMLAV